MNKTKKILILEDDETLSTGIAAAFKQDPFNFVHCNTLKEARKTIKNHKFDLLMLDVNLPDGSGVEFCREIRSTCSVPIMLLTVKDQETDIVYGYDSGADDYVTKPFTLMVLRARVRALLRRTSETQRKQDIYQTAVFHFNYEMMQFRKNGQLIELSKTEQKLLHILTDHKNQILTRSILVDRIWTDGSEYVDENALSVTIKRLRDKLEDYSSAPKYIKNIYGQGYKWDESEE